MTTIYLVRHGQAQGNLEGKCQGSVDCALSALGLKQIDALAERCKDIPFTRLFSSPLIRAQDTAKAANRYHNLEITLLPDMREICFGAWEGVVFADLEKLYPEQRRLWHEEPEKCAPLGGETMKQVYDRVSAQLLRLAKAYDGETLLIATHGCVIRNALAFASGDITKIRNFDWCANTGICRIDFDRATRQVVSYNDRQHISDDMLTF